LGISGMKGNEGYRGGEISIISQNFSKSPSILFHHLNPPFPKQALKIGVFIRRGSSLARCALNSFGLSWPQVGPAALTLVSFPRGGRSSVLSGGHFC
jgi:hypothetical protein